MSIWWYEEEKVVGLQNNGRDKELLDYFDKSIGMIGVKLYENVIIKSNEHVYHAYYLETIHSFKNHKLSSIIIE